MALLASFTAVEKASNMNHKFAFTLKPKNYTNWKTMLQPFLESTNMFPYIDGTIPCPSPTITKSASGTVSEESFAYVKGTTAKEIWDNLERGHAPHTQSREYTLKSQLMRIEMKGDELPSAYLARAMSYATDLQNIGKALDETDLVMLILTGLREECNGLKSNVLGRETPVALSDLPTLLADHDYMLHKQPTVAATFSSAFNSISCDNLSLPLPNNTPAASPQP
uniref:uncharacterized protein LOC122595309 n=1 Tax=Erigeron canadensis TaxID=72917 RepID=UPI001CB9CD12|nr:uncharacterized protein LOC122595309 [Erigeron canadensis]